ncbi:TonB-dependent receptor [Sphingomonas sp.]|jgi:outer membrane receptor protein involved in Fe transport|uniref:TonB-dependent receptor n=1 Tax=Sphingomonas sp. TaxID=28214 RepID=UPI002D7ECD55|nr:TonB-dependent receptor [Sphingomonas sp.]HEU0043670.1 TonB-dependent receptor [Sphingomonas sp.]
MTKFQLLACTAVLLTPASAWAQDAKSGTGATDLRATSATGQAQTPTDQTAGGTSTAADQGTGFADDIVVTAQRTSERLQDVPISVSAFTGAALETQQIKNSLDLQTSLPNVTFTKTNFTSASFTIRGIGDLCTGFSCDAATGIHLNDVPVPGTRLFENEFFDLERIEVLRGPQGTLFGRNATSGVVNIITARPDLSGVRASLSAEYGNYDSKKVQGMVNLPLGDTLGVRFAGQYLNRDGYTRNVFDGSRIDGRDLYQVRGSLRWQPSSSTTIDLVGAYFHEKDNRSRIQKQLCNRDASAVLGCSPDRLDNDTVNANATFASLLTSTEFFRTALSPTLAPFGIRSINNFNADAFSNFVNPTGLRTVNSSINPTYFADEINGQLRIDQDFDSFAVSLIGGYNRSRVDSTTGYFQNVPNSIIGNAGIGAFRATAPALGLTAARNALFDASGNLCAAGTDRNYVTPFNGQNVGCYSYGYNYDRSRSKSEGYSGEVKINSNFDGPFNFLLGGIYLRGSTEGDYYVVNSEGGYGAAIIGLAQGTAVGAPPGSVFRGPAYFNSETDRYRLKSYGVFGETYFQFNDALKLTLGLRYSRDEKFVRDRNPLVSILIPYNATNAFASQVAANVPGVGFDADAGTPGFQIFREAEVEFGRLTGRAVIDFKLARDSLLYASYSRGYKSGGINPPFDQTLFTAPTTFRPESVDAFEVGSKNTFMNGQLRLNASAFYYRYKDLQLSRILNRTSFNDNTNADIYGAEIEAVIRPDRNFLVNLSASYLKSKIKDFSLVDTRDPSGGRSDTVIIKDLTNASNCVLRSTQGSAAAANTFVNVVNGALGLAGTRAVAGTNTTGAISICSTLASLAAGQVPATNALFPLQQGLRAAFGVPTGALPFAFNTNAAGVATGLPDGIPVDLTGNQLPNAPMYKFTVGFQHTLPIGEFNLVTRADLNYTGEYFSRSFNRNIDRIKGYEVVNISVQLNAPDDRYFLRGFVQNLTGNDAITGQYVTDASTGLFTNVFTLEPRRYGVAAGFKF